MDIVEEKKIGLFELTKHILSEHPNGYYETLIYGKKGRGKTSYCIHTMKQVFMELSKQPDEIRYEKLEQNITLNQAYDMVLDHMVFDIESLIKKCKVARGALKEPRKMIPIITFDDAGVGLSNYLFFTNIALTNAIKGYNDILRRRVTGFLINTPNTSTLLPFIRNSQEIGVPIIKVTRERDWQSRATARERIEGKHHKRTIFIDDFSCYVPKRFYERYVDEADEAFAKQEDIIEKLFDHREERDKIKNIQDNIQKFNLKQKIEKIKRELNDGENADSSEEDNGS